MKKKPYPGHVPPRPIPPSKRPESFDDYGEGPPYHMGTGSPMHHDEEPDDIIARLHAVVEEVTGKPVEKPAKKIGFL